MGREEKKILLEVWEFLDGILVEHSRVEKELKPVLPEDLITQRMFQQMGIGFISDMYIEVNEIQNKQDEYNKIKRFLKRFLEYFANKHKISPEQLQLEFINYGKTELVYVLTDQNGNRYTILVKQPAVKFKDVYEEMQNLTELGEKDKNVIAPIDYFELGDQELFVTPYINQARCVASDGTWGIYVPEPYYRFEPFTDEQTRIVNICMIAKLVSLYDAEKHEGIANCKLGGGDFMLQKGWENEISTIENTLEQLFLIAARKKIKCSFEDYLELIRREFRKTTIDEPEETLKINIRGRVPIKPEQIEEGINLGRELLNIEKLKRTKKPGEQPNSS